MAILPAKGITADRSSEEDVVFDALAAYLQPSEMLLAFTAGRINIETQLVHRFGQHLYLGLTTDRFLLFFPKKQEILTLWRETVSDLEWLSGVRALKMYFGEESLVMTCKGNRWSDRASLFVEIDQTVPVRPNVEDDVIRRRLDEIKTLEQLGFNATAKHILDETKPGQTWETTTGQFDASLRDQRLALRVAALLFLIHIGISLLLARATAGQSYLLPIMTGIDLLIAAQLWRGKRMLWIKVATLRAILGGVLLSLIQFSTGDNAPITMHVVLAISILFILGGRRTRLRTWLGLTFFTLSYAIYLVLTSLVI